MVFKMFPTTFDLKMTFVLPYPISAAPTIWLKD